MSDASKGVLAMIGACLVWGVSPIFYKVLTHIPASEVMAHRTGWSFVFFAGVMALQGRLGEIRKALNSWRRVGVIVLAAAMISTNWFLFIIAIQVDRATEASLGYYIFPLVAVLIGRFGFGEKLGQAQWLAVGLAALAVGLLTWGLGVAPWISLVLATSFGFYSAIKKDLPLGPVVSVTCELLFILPVGLMILIWHHGHGQGAFGQGVWDSGLLVLSGPLTALPLIMFSYAARRVSLATIGLLQYINPTMQFLIAVMLFGEPFGPWHRLAFALIWGALIIFSVASLRQGRSLNKP